MSTNGASSPIWTPVPWRSTFGKLTTPLLNFCKLGAFGDGVRVVHILELIEK